MLDCSDNHITMITLHASSTCVYCFFSFTFSGLCLSLNGKDRLDSPDETPLSELGLVSGDLLLVQGEVSESHNADQNGAASSTAEVASSSDGALDVKKLKMEESESCDHSNCQSTQSKFGHTEKLDTGRQSCEHPEEHMEVSGENTDQPSSSEYEENAKEVHMVDAEVNHYLREPMLLSDATPDAIPSSLVTALQEAKPQTSTEYICVTLHILMLESGFKTMVIVS